MKPIFKSGCWSYQEDRLLIAFHPLKNDPDPEIPEYGIELDRLASSAKLLDVILQIQQKGRWSERAKAATNNFGNWLCDDYQPWDFIQVVDKLCRHYMKDSIQGVFSAWGQERQIDWDKLVSKKRRR
jgi:hypothetical protein